MEGRNILLRFQYAFLNGLCFTVGLSIAWGLDNQVTWSHTLPHRTRTNGGPYNFGFPDVTYLPTASLALDQLRVPNDPQACRQWILQNQNQPSLSTAAAVAQPPVPAVAQGSGTGAHGLAVAVATFPPAATAPIPGMGALQELAAAYVGAFPSAQNELLYYNASPFSSTGNTADLFSQYLEPVLICNETEKEEECPICLEMMVPTSAADTTTVVCIKKCQHLYHKECLVKMFELKHNKCPSCREPIGIEVHGQGPSGSLRISIKSTMRCLGFEHDSDGVIQLYYSIPSGIQTAYMENPGQHYSGTTRIAYLPHNESGRNLLVRLKYAFTHGLTFRVGSSLTTGQPNTITWTSIHHKTSLDYGMHGYPDPHYLANCNGSLDALRVPKT